MVPAEVERWFRDSEKKPELERRVDHYFSALPGDALGIKVRQGNLEHKLRSAEGDPARWHDRIAGCVEQWRKWSFRLAADDAAQAAIAAGEADWLRVEKSRWSRKYAVTADRRVEPTPVVVRVDQGCTLELTLLVVKEQEWWTLGFEAFGAEGALRDHLDLVVAHVISQARKQPPDLVATASCGYPCWLRRIADAG
jgi:hypothetical protein